MTETASAMAVAEESPARCSEADASWSAGWGAIAMRQGASQGATAALGRGVQLAPAVGEWPRCLRLSLRGSAVRAAFQVSLGFSSPRPLRASWGFHRPLFITTSPAPFCWALPDTSPRSQAAPPSHKIIARI